MLSHLNDREAETPSKARAPSLILLALLCLSSTATAHDVSPVTHLFDAGVPQPGPRLELTITDGATGYPLAARVSVSVDGKEFVPAWVDEHGIRFTSIHRTRQQRFTALYARGTGRLAAGLPAGAHRVTVTVARGFEYVPGYAKVAVEGDRAAVKIALRRWSDLAEQGWIAVEEHMHYDRLDPEADADWLTMLDADGLDAAHVLVAKGGMMPGIWAAQFAYGAKGQATRGGRWLVPGEEYRDNAQGHILLLGADELVEPISTGGLGTPAIMENFPPLHDVLMRGKMLHGLVGVAHGGMSGTASTALAEAVLGAVDFWEISNGFIHSTEWWYRLMNCGIFLPPGAGTDLPNFPFRDPWQPLLGSTRTYVRTGGRTDFVSFKSATLAGRVFLSDGPLISLTVDGHGPGETIHIPDGGGTISIRAELRSTQPLRALRIIHDGRPLELDVQRANDGIIDVLTVEHRLPVAKSGWIAAAGTGTRISLGFDARAHTGAVRVLVGQRPIRVDADVTRIAARLEQHREFYRKEARYRSDEDRAHMLDVFERALARLRSLSQP